MPWTKYTLEKFSAHKLPPGPVLVPACGPGKAESCSAVTSQVHQCFQPPNACTGHEMLMLAKQLPEKLKIIGIDIAPGMVDLANERCTAAGIR